MNPDRNLIGKAEALATPIAYGAGYLTTLANYSHDAALTGVGLALLGTSGLLLSDSIGRFADRHGGRKESGWFVNLVWNPLLGAGAGIYAPLQLLELTKNVTTAPSLSNFMATGLLALSAPYLLSPVTYLGKKILNRRQA